MKVAGHETQSRKGVHLWLLLWKATRTLEVHARRSVQATGLGLSDFGVLEALLHKGPLAVNALRKKVLLSSGSTTAAVDRLEGNGLVERASAPADRRGCIVHLTEKGSNLIRALFRDHARDMERVFSCLGPDERSALASLLHKVGRGPEHLAANQENASANKEGRS
ncbi:MAG: MarR family winged helix-turn-helix transcriptional regulator [Bryobacteraceae bacterium]